MYCPLHIKCRIEVAWNPWLFFQQVCQLWIHPLSFWCDQDRASISEHLKHPKNPRMEMTTTSQFNSHLEDERRKSNHQEIWFFLVLIDLVHFFFFFTQLLMKHRIGPSCQKFQFLFDLNNQNSKNNNNITINDRKKLGKFLFQYVFHDTYDNSESETKNLKLSREKSIQDLINFWFNWF